MGEEISRLMDGELDDELVESVCAGMRHPDGVSTWVCYHVIGDALRGNGVASRGFSERFALRLAAEPTIVAPKKRQARPLAFAWAAAATLAAISLVGWVALDTIDTQSGVVAKAREAATVRAAKVRPQAVPNDYLLAHQEYSPTAQIQGVGPGLRSASALAQPR